MPDLLYFLLNAGLMYIILKIIVVDIDDYKTFIGKFLIIYFSTVIAVTILRYRFGYLVYLTGFAIFVLGFTQYLYLSIRQSVVSSALFFGIIILLRILSRYTLMIYGYIFVFALYGLWEYVVKKRFEEYFG